MGKGDKRTRKGKISAGSYGNSRPHGEVTTAIVTAKPTPVAKKAPVRKPAAKKV